MSGYDKTVLNACQNKIQVWAQSLSCKLHLTDKVDMAEWPQNVIQKYYEYCLKRQVIPTLDIENSILDLMGTKDTVC